MKNRFYALISYALTLVLLSSCGELSQTAQNDPGGGIDGTGFTLGSGNGDITGFGSVLFGDSEFEVNVDTNILIDGLDVAESDLKVGMVADYFIGDDASSDLTMGTAQLISVTSLLKGPVTSESPLEVLGLPVLIDSNTQCEAINCAAATLTVGDIVTVYGFQGDDNIVRATRLALNSAFIGNLPLQWKLAGRVDAVGQESLTVGSQVISTVGATIEDCGSAIAVGDAVTVLAAPNSVAGFATLNMVQSIRCGKQSILLPPDAEKNTIFGKAEGIISGYTGAGDTQFFVGGQRIEFAPLSPVLQIENGTVADLVNGARVEVEGSFDTSTRLLHAQEIEFESTRLEIVAPVDPATINQLDASFEIMTIPVQINLATSDEVGMLSGGLTAARQLSIKAKVDAGQVIAEEIRDEGTPKFDEVKIQGPVENIVINTSFDILGLEILVQSSTQYSDANEQPLSGATEFFSLISTGDRLEVKGEYILSPTVNLLAEEVEQ